MASKTFSHNTDRQKRKSRGSVEEFFSVGMWVFWLSLHAFTPTRRRPNMESCIACGGKRICHTETGVIKRCNGKTEQPPQTVLWQPQNRHTHTKRADRNNIDRVDWETANHISSQQPQSGAQDRPAYAHPRIIRWTLPALPYGTPGSHQENSGRSRRTHRRHRQRPVQPQ